MNGICYDVKSERHPFINDNGHDHSLFCIENLMIDVYIKTQIQTP